MARRFPSYFVDWSGERHDIEATTIPATLGQMDAAVAPSPRVGAVRVILSAGFWVYLLLTSAVLWMVAVVIWGFSGASLGLSWGSGV